MCERERSRARARARERKRKGDRNGGRGGKRVRVRERESKRPIGYIEEHMCTVTVPRVRLESSVITKRVFSLLRKCNPFVSTKRVLGKK